MRGKSTLPQMTPPPTAGLGDERRIRASEGYLRLDWRELWAYRDLLVLLIKRDFLAKYKQTVLGPIWFIVQPVMMTLVFTLFGRITNISTDALPGPLFYMSGLLSWNYFSATFGAVGGTFSGNMHIFSKVYFPRLIVPLALVASNLLTFLVQLVCFCAFFAYFKCFTSASDTFSVSSYIALLPLVIVQTMALSLGVGLCIASATAKYRDLVQVLGMAGQVWLYATPIIYPASRVPADYHWLLALNPMTGIVESFRFLMLGRATLSWPIVVTLLTLTTVILLLGLLCFRRVERTVVDFV